MLVVFDEELLNFGTVFVHEVEVQVAIHVHLSHLRVLFARILNQGL